MHNGLKDLEYSNRELQDYARAVSHDLKSPLRNMHNLVSWLIDDLDFKISKQNAKTVTLIYENIEKMESLINGILSYSMLDNTLVKKEIINLNDLILDIIKSLDVPKNIQINLLCKFPEFKADKYKIQQLFQNLIANAIKYNNKKEGIIDIDCSQTDSHYQFSVKDNGVGIEKSQFKKIFKMFHKIENKKGSTGIGLAIVEKIVHLYNGKIWLESTYKKGSTFHFTLNKF